MFAALLNTLLLSRRRLILHLGTIPPEGVSNMQQSKPKDDTTLDYSAIRKALKKLFPNNPLLVSIIMTLLKLLGPAVLAYFGLSQSGLL
jgi:hypothetical protein